MRHRAGLALLLSLAPACAGAGPYGFAPKYVELGDEASSVAPAVEYDSSASRRSRVDPSQEDRPVTFFGVVDAREIGAGGKALLKLEVRRLQSQNSCVKPGDDSSCRVTVGTTSFGVVWVLLSLRGDDDIGPGAVGQRSLLRVVGPVSQDVSATDGAPVIRASWYRHWPAFFFASVPDPS